MRRAPRSARAGGDARARARAVRALYLSARARAASPPLASARVAAELKDQSVMLSEVERDMDETSEKMNFAMRKLQKLLKTKDNCQIWTIVVLVLVLGILVAMVIWL